MNISSEISSTTIPSWHRIRMIEHPVLRYGLMVLTLVYILWSLGTLDISWHRISTGSPRAINMFARMIPPDFSRWALLVKGVLESIQMALAASFFGMLLSIPLGLCGASNIVPKPVYLVARTLIVLSRTFHEIIIAIFFVKIFGFGPLAGVLTLIVASTSFISKMIAEDIENLPPGHLEAIRATGASFPKLLIYCISPRVLPRYLGVSIYRLDANIRHSTVVGIVGAGGIGQVLAATFSRYDYDFSLTILMTIVALVFLGEFFSSWVRGYLR
ncbi:MAG: phosphonate ABC transporter, permease protein PhnE [Desulfobacterales bacterium]|nr:phosphonate ABC transporter, permease protein PhnE [Desulfobacterales bacterium]MDX2512432.1 phosphonate ABC transporter, permease protein PhnE [Desulfobacterales bacterium]